MNTKIFIALAMIFVLLALCACRAAEIGDPEISVSGSAEIETDPEPETGENNFISILNNPELDLFGIRVLFEDGAEFNLSFEDAKQVIEMLSEIKAVESEMPMWNEPRYTLVITWGDDSGGATMYSSESIYCGATGTGHYYYRWTDSGGVIGDEKSIIHIIIEKAMENSISKLEISVAYATEEILEQYPSFNEFKESDDDIYQLIIIRPNIAVRDFKFLAIDQNENSSAVYSLDELSPEKPFIATCRAAGPKPSYGISFVDDIDKTRYYYIETRDVGDVNTLVLIEFFS